MIPIVSSMNAFTAESVEKGNWSGSCFASFHAERLDVGVGGKKTLKEHAHSLGINKVALAQGTGRRLGRILPVGDKIVVQLTILSSR